MRALVTGAAGFIGSRLVGALATRDWHVTAVDSFSPYYDVAIKRTNAKRLDEQHSVAVIDDSVASADLAPWLEGADVVFHLAAQPGVRASWDDFGSYVRDNLTATQRLLDAARSLHTPKVVFASSSSVYGQVTGTVTEKSPTHPFSPYGVTKLAAEALCHAYAQNFGLPTVSLRLFTVYGPGQRPDMAFSRLIDAAFAGKTFTVYGDGRQLRAFTYVDDVVDAMMRAAKADLEPGTTLNVSGGSIATLNQAIAAVESATGATIHAQRRADQPGDVRRTDADISQAQRVLGWQPGTPLTVGIRQQVDEARARQVAPHAEIAVSQ